MTTSYKPSPLFQNVLNQNAHNAHTRGLAPWKSKTPRYVVKALEKPYKVGEMLAKVREIKRVFFLGFLK